MDNFFQKLCKEFKPEQENTQPLGCCEWTGTLKYKSSYEIIKFHLPGHKIILKFMHRVKYICHLKDLNILSDLNVSYLCHNPKCLNINHLTSEHHEINMAKR